MRPLPKLPADFAGWTPLALGLLAYAAAVMIAFSAHP